MPALGQISVPVHFVWRAEDRLVPEWMRERRRSAVPTAVETTLTGAPHCPHLQDPARVARLLLAA